MFRTSTLSCLSFLFLSSAAAQTPPTVRTVERPVSFLANQGQAPADILWEGRGNGFTVSFYRESFVLRVSAADSKMIEQRISLEGIDAQARIEALDPLPGKVSFLAGSDPSRWIRGLATYSRLRYRKIYPGVDLVFYGNQGKLEYDFVVSPGADPRRIRLGLDGTARVTDRGELLLGSGAQATIHRPKLYQNLDGGKREIEGRFGNVAKGMVTFQCGDYDRTRPLIIDPTVNVLDATYLGGIHDDAAFGVALDPQNNSYILGVSASQDYPISASAYQSARTNIGTYTYNMVLTKMSPSGALLYSTFIGDGTDTPFRNPVLTTDALGHAWIGGVTTSPTFPVTANAYQPTFPPSGNPGGTNLCPFLTEVSTDGSSLLYSTFFGGPTGPYYNVLGIAVNGSGQVYLAGIAGAGLPTTPGAYLASIQPSNASSNFVAAFDPTKTGSAQLVASSYFGTPSFQFTNLGGMALDASSNPWIVAQTNDTSLPTTAGAIQPSADFSSPVLCGEGFQPQLSDGGYVAKLSADLTTLLYGSYLSGGQATKQHAGCDESILRAVTDVYGDLYLLGFSGSDQFPVSANAYQTFQQDVASPNAPGNLRFVTALSSDGSQLLFSTFLGTTSININTDYLAVDGQLNAWVASNLALPLTTDALQSSLISNQGNGSVAEISSDGTTLLYGTYLPQLQAASCKAAGGNSTIACGTTIRGLAVDQQSNAYITGNAAGPIIPTTANAYQSQFANGNTASDGNDIFFMILGGGTVNTLNPTSGGNTGDTTITITGAGFQQGATCSLVQGQTTISATAVSVASNGASVSCTFPLNGAATGMYDVSVSNPDGSGFTDSGAFTVGAGGQPQIWTALSGRSTIRVATPSQVLLNYGNSGTEDAYLTTLWIALPSAYSFTIAGLTNPTDINCPALGLSPIFFSQGGVSYIPLLVPLIPAGSSNTIVITVTAPAAGSAVELEGYAELPWFSLASTTTQVLSAAAASPANVPSACVSGTGTADCLGPLSTAAQPVIVGYLATLGITDPTIAADVTANLAADLETILASASANEVLPWQLIFDEVAADIATRRFGITGQCNAPFRAGDPPAPMTVVLPPPCPKGFEWASLFNLLGTSPCKNQTPEQSIDPNDKSGPDGDGSVSRYVRATSPFVYTVAFENQASAALPAAQVVVTDTLDPAKLDLTTLSLGTISFGTHVIPVPPNSSNFNALFPISSSLSVRIQGSLNLGTNTLKWTFTSIDPSTGLPPSDPTVGFLPPDADGVQGQGSVNFTVTPKSGQTTGTQISNTASVVFDTNAAIATPTWLNTLDVSAPHSSVAALPSQEAQTSFNVSWTGTDVGSGIASYTIYVSDNGAAATVFQNSVSTTSASFTGQAGHRYGFYSIAVDRAGNAESKTGPDTTTTVAGGTSGSKCDVNKDGATNVSDVQLIINEALGVTAANNDLNADGAINVADVQIVINAALGLGCSAL